MASNSTSQGPLDIALRQSPFPQTGSWNMLDIAKLPVQLTVGMLSRYAAARVNPYTVVVAEAMGMTFRMGRKGRSNVEQSLSKLSAVGTLNHALFIGFGIDDFTRSMVKSESGAMAVGLCAALRECFDEDTAIEVMLEYARMTKADRQWMPSNMEWRSLLNACAGCLSSSNFAVRAEHLMRLSESFGCPSPREWKHQRIRPSPRSMAAALVALARLSNDELESVVIKGRACAGWLAAVAEWFLDLTVEILVEHSGETMYRNHSEKEKTQITVVYNHILPWCKAPTDHNREAYEADGNRSSNAQQNSDFDIIHVENRACQISLEDVHQLFVPNLLSENKTCSGRVPWNSALEYTFGSDFQRLMQSSEAFGSMIGCAAVISYWISRSHDDLPRDYLRAYLGYCDSSHGRGFANCAVQWLPELHHLREHMASFLRLSFGDAKKGYDASVALLVSRCRCSYCRKREDLYELSMDFENDEWVESGQKFRRSRTGVTQTTQRGLPSPSYREASFCLVILAETIIKICEYLSNAVIHTPDLLPTRSGIEKLYLSMSETFAVLVYPDDWLREVQSMGQIAFYQYREHHWSGDHRFPGTATQRRMNALLQLFSGAPSRDSIFGQSAKWFNGISAFSDILLPSRCNGRDMIGRVHLVAGRIHFEGKSYEELADPQYEFAHEKDSSVLEASPVYTVRMLSIRETSISLEGRMQFIPEHDGEDRAPIITTGPAALVDNLAERRGLVFCSSTRAKFKCAIPLEIPQPTHPTSNAWAEYSIGEHRIRFVRSSSTIQAMVIMASLDDGFDVYIVDDQCENCCLRTALTKEAQEGRLGRPDTAQIVYFVYIT